MDSRGLSAPVAALRESLKELPSSRGLSNEPLASSFQPWPPPKLETADRQADRVDGELIVWSWKSEVIRAKKMKWSRHFLHGIFTQSAWTFWKQFTNSLPQ